MTTTNNTTINNTINNIDANNREQQTAFDLLAHTNVSFFLTGRAGTGKTTFLNAARNSVDKQFVTLAPTGVAAILAGGETIHSFFGLPLEVCGPGTVGKMNPMKKRVLKHADTIIIDEVSMMRCDVADAIDSTMRSVLKTELPFGGKQMVFVGDMFQLSPVVKAGAEAEMLKDLYHTKDFSFYNAFAVKGMDMVKIEFRKMYRQSNLDYLNVLEHVRMGQVSQADLDLLNTRVGQPSDKDGMVITLASLNKTAYAINHNLLDAIKAPAQVYTGKVKGKFDAKRMPVEMDLRLKPGAQVMFARNDQNKRWVNGTIGTVVKADKEEVQVRVASGDVYNVEPETWEAVNYEYDKEARRLKKTVMGTFTQYPLRLAWAVTIHKSQGMTFDKMVINLTRGLFAPGQLYVALSRVRSLDGLFLSCEVKPGHVKTRNEVIAFANDYNDGGAINRAMTEGKAMYAPLRHHNYDAVARIYLERGVAKTFGGDMAGAAKEIKTALDTVVCDDALFDIAIEHPFTPLAGARLSELFVAAVLALYTRHYDRAIDYADKVLSVRQCREMVYIKGRALEMQKRYTEAATLYDTIMVEAGSIVPDVKLFYTSCMLAENHLQESGLFMLAAVLRLRPEYNRAIVAFRSLVRRHGKTLFAAADGPTALVEAFNSSCSDEAFGKKLEQSRRQAPEEVDALFDAFANMDLDF